MTQTTQKPRTEQRKISLQDAIHNKVNLSPKHIDNFKSMFLKGMRSPRRKYQIERIDNVQDLVKFRDKWWASRFIFYEDGRCQYYAGQDHTAEISMIRDDIVGFK